MTPGIHFSPGRSAELSASSSAPGNGDGKDITTWQKKNRVVIYRCDFHILYSDTFSSSSLVCFSKKEVLQLLFFMSSVQFYDTIYTHTHTHTTFTRVPWQKGNWDILGRLSQCHILTEMFLLSTQTIVQILISSPRVPDDIWIGRGVTWQSDVTPILATIVGLFVMAGFQNQQIRLLSATIQITEELFQ